MKRLLFFAFTLMLCTTAVAQSKKQMDKRIDEAAIPKDVLNKDYVLLVKIQFKTKSWTEKFQKMMEEHYTGKFEIVPYDVPIDETYPDTKKYRYIMAAPQSLSKKDFTGPNAEIANDKKGIAPESAWSKDVHMVDRQHIADFVNTHLSGNSDLKIMAYFADRLSGKEGTDE